MAFGEVGGGAQAVADGLAVPEPAIVCDRFESVPDGVAEVEGAARARLPFVARHDLRLDPAAFGDDERELVRVVGENRVKPRGDAVEERTRRDDAVFQHLVETCPEFAGRE